MFPNPENTPSASQNPTSQETNRSQPTHSYAAAIQKNQFPKKDQAIVIDSITDIPIDKYIFEIGKLTNPSNIRFVLRISGNRVCVYLDSKQTVNDLTTKHTHIVINDNTLQLRPLITQHKRLILSNVCPIIPYYILIDALNQLKIRINSSMTFLRARISNPGYSHILSFRRQVYIHPDDEKLIPESLQINYEETTYWIYPSTDTLKCFLCKQSGHIAKQCTQFDTATSDQPVEMETTINDNQKPNDSLQFPPLEIQVSTDSPRNKRPLSDTKSTKSNDSTKNLPNDLTTEKEKNETNPVENRQQKQKSQQNKHTNKKSKFFNTSPEISSNEPPNSIQDILDDPENKYPLNYMQYKSFIDNTKGIKNIAPMALEYCKDLNSLITMLTDLYPLLNNKTAKSKHTKIINKLKKILSDADPDETDDDTNSTNSET